MSRVVLLSRQQYGLVRSMINAGRAQGGKTPGSGCLPGFQGKIVLYAVPALQKGRDAGRIEL